MPRPENVAIFWDYDRCPISPNLNGYEITNNIRSIAHTFGSVVLFKAYLGISSSTKPPNVLLELQASGVSLTDCPRKDASATNSMMIVDMIAHAMDHPPPTTFLVVSGNQDNAYAISFLRLRRYRVVVVCPSTSHPSVITQASVHIDWNAEVLVQSASERSPAEADVFNSLPQVAGSRRRANSTSAGVALPPTSATSRAVESDGESADDDDLYSPHGAVPSRNPKLTRTNGFPGEYTYTPDHLSKRHSPVRPSWTVPEAYSSPAPFRSPKHPPAAVPPAEGFTSSNHAYDSRGLHISPRSNMTSLKGFPLDEPESITLKGSIPAAENPGQGSSWLTRNVPPVSPQNPDAPSAPNFALPTTPTSVPPPTPLSLPDPVSNYFTPVANPQPAQIPAAAPLPKSSSTMGSPVRAPTTAPPTRAATPRASSTPAAPVMKPQAESKPSSTPPSRPASRAAQVPSAPKQQPIPASSSVQPGINRAVPVQFQALVDVLEARRRSQGQIRVSRSELGTDLSKHKTAYKQAGVNKFASYIELAQNAGIVDLGSTDQTPWVMLRPEWSPVA